jgi:flagellar protein FliS
MLDVADAYKKVQIGTANPVKLVVMMYDGVSRFLLKAEKAILAKDVKETDFWTDKASAVVQELLSALDLEAGGQVAAQLLQVYTMTIREILHARIRRDPELLRKLSSLYSDLSSGWEQISSSKGAKASD